MQRTSDQEILSALGHGERKFGWDEWFGDVDGADYLTDRGKQAARQAHHVTGDDCFMLKLLARSMTDLERLAGKLAGLGAITTSVVYSSPLARRALVPPS
jgi:DNA-binding Lrp family transcriptional regulator